MPVLTSISDPVLRLALWAGIVAVALTLGVAATVLLLRANLRRRERRWNAFVQSWRPALTLAALGEAGSGALPRLARVDHPNFLRLWAYLHESLRGDASERLNQLAFDLRMDAAARRLLRSRSRGRRLQAALAVGYLRDPAAWDDLRRLAAGRDGLVAVHAARALVRIDPRAAPRVLMPLIMRRHDWDLARVAAFLAEAREAFGVLLVQQVPQLPPQDLPRALLLARALRLQLPDDSLRFLLAPGQPAAVVAAALPLAGPALAAEVRGGLSHADPGVRAAAAQHFAGMAMRGDVGALASLLADTHWPVRRAAAQALAALPFLDDAQLRALAPPAGPAADVMAHVLAEREPA